MTLNDRQAQRLAWFDMTYRRSMARWDRSIAGGRDGNPRHLERAVEAAGRAGRMLREALAEGQRPESKRVGGR